MDIKEFASRGGTARAKKLSKERRLEISQKANEVRKRKAALKKKAPKKEPQISED